MWEAIRNTWPRREFSEGDHEMLWVSTKSCGHAIGCFLGVHEDFAWPHTLTPWSPIHAQKSCAGYPRHSPWPPTGIGWSFTHLTWPPTKFSWPPTSDHDPRVDTTIAWPHQRCRWPRALHGHAIGSLGRPPVATRGVRVWTRKRWWPRDLRDASWAYVGAHV